MKNIFLLSYGLLSVLIIGCRDQEMGPLSKGGPAPVVVSNVIVNPLHGGAEISYTLPEDPNLLYVKAVYEIRPGKPLEQIATFYNSYLKIEGFADTAEHEVKLYSVSRSGIYSEPVVIHVTPLSAPIINVYKSLNAQADFGGVTVRFLNEDSANVVISVLARDSTGDWSVADVYYTSLKSGKFSVRGFPSESREFGFTARDRWDNRSDTMRLNLTPLYETKLDKKKFKLLTLPGDATFTLPATNLWDDNLLYPNFLRTSTGSGIPHWYTFDLGEKAKLSRYVMMQRGAFDENSLLYSAGDPRLWEVWGSNDPAPDGSFEGWTKLLDCEGVKPSGAAIGQNTNDDIAQAQAGQEFTFGLDAPAVRYIRIKILQTWGNADYMWMAELTFYGQQQ